MSLNGNVQCGKVENNRQLTMIDETLHVAIGLHLNLQFPLVQKGCRGDDESSFACRIL